MMWVSWTWELHFDLFQGSMKYVRFSKPPPGLGRLRVVGLASQVDSTKKTRVSKRMDCVLNNQHTYSNYSLKVLKFHIC